MKKEEPGVPQQKVGEEQNTIEQKCYDSVDQAKEAFNKISAQLMDIDTWQEQCGGLSAAFVHMTPQGKKANAKPTLGNYIRIDIQGMGSKIGEAYDWVKIIKIDKAPYDKDERYFMQCKPSINPTDEDTEEVEHFYSDQASISFIVFREGECVTVEILGRNEVKNDDTSKLTEKLRNAIIAFGGKMGMGLIQWSNLAEGLINTKI